MPELPEVETTRRGLQKEIVGLTIREVWTDLATEDKRKVGTVANPAYFPVFRAAAKGKKILSVERRAKNVLINLSGGKTILVHMKMTGYLFYGKDPKIKFAHVIFSLSNKKYLVFSDLRKFGKILLLDTKNDHFKNIGPEPLDKNFDLATFRERLLRRPNSKIKSALMDQALIAGIGNIYSDEILFRACVHPERRTASIKDAEFKKMFKAIKETLQKGIDFGGDSMSDYKNIYGKPGEFQLHHQVYRRTGEACGARGCKGKILRVIVGGRSAHYCSVHQK